MENDEIWEDDEICIDEKIQFEESIERMKELGISSNIINRYKRNYIVPIAVPPLGEIIPVEDKIERVIDKFEESNDATIYYGIQRYATYGLTYSFLFVSKWKAEWNIDRNDLENLNCVAFVYNDTTPEYSETGYIQLAKTPIGSLVRIG